MNIEKIEELNIEIKKLELKISNLEDWIKEISIYWNGANSFQQFVENIRQAKSFKNL